MAQLIPTATSYHRPDTPEELAHLIGDGGTSSFIMAGGTSFAFSRPAVQRIIDLNRLPWKGCRSLPDGALEIGALTTVGDMEKDPLVIAFCGGLLRQASDKLASTPLRNLITVGGNLTAGFAWCDLPVALIAMDTRYRVFPDVAGSDGIASAQPEPVSGNLHPLPIDGERSLRQLTRSGQVLSHVVLDGSYARARGAFIKFARTASDLALVSVAVTFIPAGKRMSRVRVVAGGLVSTPRRLTEVELLLEGKEPDDGLFETAGRTAAVMPRPDTRATEEYRLDVLKTLVTRACRQAAGGGSDEN